jgi:predicted ferric reductase
MQKYKVGPYILIILSLSPIIPWLFAQPIITRGISAYSLFSTFGELTGLVGTAMFALVLVLSARLKFMGGYFGGMNKVYVAHHRFAAIAFLLILIHVLTVAFAAMVLSPHYAATFLLPGNVMARNLGITSLLLMIGIMLFTLYVKLSYESWKLIHRLFGIAFLIGVIHGFYAPSDIARNVPLSIYMFILLSLGIIAYLYRSVFGRFLVVKREYIIDTIKVIKNNVTAIELTPKDKKLDIVPGQFALISFKDPNVPHEEHPFSVSSVSEDGKITFAIKALGDFTEKIKELQIGDSAYVEGGYGKFSFQNYQNKRQIWIAGGIGVIPFVSMAISMTKGYTIDVYYMVKDESEAVYLPILQYVGGMFKTFKVHPHYTKEKGRLNAELIQKDCPDALKRDIFLCGPPPMMNSMTQQFIKLGVPKDSIHSDSFSL